MNELYGILVENLPFPVWIKDLKNKFIYVNSEYLKLHNKKKEDLIGKKNNAIFSESLSEDYDKKCEYVIKYGLSSTVVMYTVSGYRKCTIIPLKDDLGNVLAIAGIVGVITDLEKIKEKEYEAETHKSLTKQIIDILPGAIFFKDIDGKYIYANSFLRKLFASKGVYEVLGKTDAEINNNKEQLHTFNKEDQYIIMNKKSITSEVVFSDEEGNKVYNEVVKVPLLDKEGNITGIVGRVLDITERRTYQDKLENLSYTDILTKIRNRASFEEAQVRLSIEENLPLGIIMGDVNGLKLVNDTFGHAEGDNLLKDIARVLDEGCKKNGEVFRIGGDEFVILLPRYSLRKCETLIEEILKKCKENDNQLYSLSISLGAAVKYTRFQDTFSVLKEAEDKVYRQKLLQNKSIKSSILNSLKIGLGVRSGETEQHTERVASFSIKVGKNLGLEMSELDELKIAADLHDIGKIGISEEILLKPGKLTESEYEIIKTHCEKGYRIVKASSELRNVAESVLYHHERWDGKGYPIGLKGEAIPILSRIISLCDSFDVMINDRVYKKAMSIPEAMAEIKRCSGTQFDPKVVEAFLQEFE